MLGSVRRSKIPRPRLLLLPFLLLAVACAAPPDYDVILRGGTLYDGSGEPPRIADLALRGDRIAAMGDLGPETMKRLMGAVQEELEALPL